MHMLSHKKFRHLTASMLTVALLGFASVAGAATLREGDKSNEVAQVQNVLHKLGYKVMVDGSFGPSTTTAVKAFQQAKGLEVDGLVGPITYNVLMSNLSEDPSRGGSGISRRIVSVALSVLGVPYVWGGTTPRGFDCSGFVQYVYNQVGLSLPRTADVQFEVGTAIPTSKLRAGDLVFFSTYEPGPSHVGIYLGDGNFVHASSNTGISVTPMFTGYYGPRYIGARRL